MPAPTNGTFLLDTGASHTCIDKSLLAPLGLTPTGQMPMHTPSTGSTPIMADLYDVMLFVPGATGLPGWIIEAVAVTECDFSAQGIHGLIGRDILNKAILVYNGPAGQYSLAY
jgi:hypothetical protein